MVETSWPRAWWRTVPSICWPVMRMPPTSQRLECPVAQEGHFPQAGTNPSTTWSPPATVGHAGADRFDHPGTLVAADDGERHGHVAGDQVLVGMAHARGRQLDEHLALFGRVELDGLDAPVAWRSHRTAASVCTVASYGCCATTVHATGRRVRHAGIGFFGPDRRPSACRHRRSRPRPPGHGQVRRLGLVGPLEIAPGRRAIGRRAPTDRAASGICQAVDTARARLCPWRRGPGRRPCRHAVLCPPRRPASGNRCPAGAGPRQAELKSMHTAGEVRRQGVGRADGGAPGGDGDGTRLSTGQLGNGDLGCVRSGPRPLRLGRLRGVRAFRRTIPTTRQLFHDPAPGLTSRPAAVRDDASVA